MDGYLYHHGILNQKWGVRNGPPYPLSKEQYSPAEQKAIAKAYQKSAKKGDFSRWGNREINSILESKSQLKEIEKVARDYWGLSDEEQDKYINKCLIEVDNVDPNSEEGQWRKSLYKYEDFDQTLKDNPSGMYINDHYKGGYDKWENDYFREQEKYSKACEEYTDKLLGAYGDLPVNPKNPYYKISDSFMLEILHQFG